MILKQWYNDLRSVQSVINSISSIRIWVDGATGLLNTSSLTAITNAVSGLNKEQALLVLSTKGLTKAQQEQVLVSAGIIATEDKITATIASQALANSSLSASKQQQILINAGLMNGKTQELIITESCTKAKLEEALATQRVVGTDAEAIFSSLGLTTANGAQAVSFDVLTSSIWANIKALGIWLATNPIGWAILGGTAMFGLVKAHDALTKKYVESQKKIVESSEEAVSEYEEEISSLKDLQKSLQEAKGNKSELAKIQSELNKVIGETPGLLNSEVSAYEIANKKIEDRIARLSELKKAEMEEAVTAQKNIFNSKKIENAWGVDKSLDDYINGAHHGVGISALLGASYSKYLSDEFTTEKGYIDLYKIFENLIQNGYGDKNSNAKIWSEILTTGGVAFVSESEIQDYFDKQSETAKEIFSDYIENTDSIFDKTELNSMIESLVENGYSSNLEGIKKVLTDITSDSELEDAINKYYESLGDESADSEALYNNVKAMFDELTVKYPELKFILDNYFDSIGTDIETAKENVLKNSSTISFDSIFKLEDSKGNATELSSINSKLEEIVSSYQALKNAVKDYETTGSISMSTLKSLMESGDEWISYLNVENGQLKINEQAYYDVANARLYELRIQALQNLSDQVTGLKNVGEAQEWVKQQVYDTADSYDTLASSIKNKTIQELKSKIASSDDKDKEKWQSALDKYISDFDKINKTFNAIDAQSLLSGSTTGLSDNLSTLKSHADLINSVNGDLKDNGKITLSTLQSIASAFPILEGYVRDYINGVEGSEEKLITKLNECYQTDIDNYKEYCIAKSENDEALWESFVEDCGGSVNALADQYGIDLHNYASYAEAQEAINNKLIESYNALLAAKQLVNNVTTGDLSNSATVAGLSSDQKSVANSLWSKWKEEYLSRKNTSITYKDMEDQLVHGGLQQGTAKQLATELRQQLVHLSQNASQSYYDTLKSTQLDFESAFNSYVGQKVDTDFDSSVFSPENFDTASSDKSPETFDWVETKLNNLTETLEKLKAKASDTYSTWTTRNTALQQAIAKTQESINLQAQAYQTYMNKANSVGLSDYYKRLIQNGAMDISPISNSDENLAEKISEYQEWYNKAKACLNTQQDLQNSLNELNSQKFTNIKSEYEAVTNTIQQQKDLLESQITLLSSGSTYTQLRNQQNSIISQLQAERNILSSTLNSMSITRGSEEWNNLSSEIAGIDQSIQDAKDALKEIDTLQFNNVKESFDFNTEKLDHALQLMQDKTDLLEMNGLFANEKYYNSMLVYTQQKIDNLQNEKSHLQNLLNNSKYQQGTSEWNDMFSSLMNIDKEISSLNNDMIDFNNTIRNLNWDVFEYLEESIGRITDETDYLIDLMSSEKLYDDNGKMTEYAAASVALHASAYDVYKQQAQDYYEEVQTLQKQLVDGAGKDVLEQYHDMIDAHQDAVSAAQDEKEAILNLTEDGLNAQLDALQKLIDKKKDSLNAEKDLHDYQKDINEQTKNIASLEKQQISVNGDDSEDAMAKIQQLKVQLEEAKENLKETEYDKYLSDTETLLDQLAADYEDWMNARLDNEDALLAEIVGQVGTQGGQIMDTLNMVAAENGTMISEYIGTIFSTDSPFTTSLTNGLYDISNNTVGAVNNLNTTLETGFRDTAAAVSGTTAAVDKLVGKIADITNAAAQNTSAGSGGNPDAAAGGTAGGSYAGSYTPIYTNPNSPDNTSGSGSVESVNSSGSGIFEYKYDSYPKDKLQINTSLVDRLKKNNYDSSFSARSRYWTRLGFSGTYTGSESQNTKLLDYLKNNGYKKGTSYVPEDGIYPTQEDGPEFIEHNGTLLVPLKRGDRVFNAEDTAKIMALLNHSDAIYKYIPSGLNPGMNAAPVYQNSQNTISFGDTYVQVAQANNIEDIVDGLTTSHRFEDMICYMTNEKIMGRSAIGKNKFVRH